MDEQTPEQKARFERDEYCRGLRELAEFFEQNLEVPLPNHEMRLHVWEKSEIVAAAKTSGKWDKDYSGGFFFLSRKFRGITLLYQTYRDNICERKVVGTKVVPAVSYPEYQEDIVEWECKDPLLKPTTEE